jgi:hypothetical protein
MMHKHALEHNRLAAPEASGDRPLKGYRPRLYADATLRFGEEV